MFSAQEVRWWCDKQARVHWNAEFAVPVLKARNFYKNWLALLLQLIDDGYDMDGIFKDTALLLLDVIKECPPKVSYVYPFARDSRDVEKIARMYVFFGELGKVCARMERREMEIRKEFEKM